MDVKLLFSLLLFTTTGFLFENIFINGKTISNINARTLDTSELPKNTESVSMEQMLNFEKKQKELKINTILPNISFYDVKEKRMRKFDELKGKVKILDFWFSTCSPCIKAIPKLNEIRQRILETDSSVEFWAFTFNDEKTVNEFIDKNKFDFRIGIIERFTIDYYELSTGYPTYYIIDKNNGVSDYTKFGYFDKQNNTFKLDVTVQIINNGLNYSFFNNH